MRKSCFIFIALTLLPAASCVRESCGDPAGTMVIEAAVNVTKTHLEGLKVLWDSSDAIVVNNMESSSTEISQGGRTALFTLPSISGPLYAFYPASAFVSGSVAPELSQYGGMIFPSVQNFHAGTFDPSAALMTAYSSSSEESLHFIHSAAYLKIAVGGSHHHPIKSIEVSSAAGEDMSGVLACNPETGLLEGETYSGLTTKLVCPDGSPQGEPVYLAIPAKTYSQGICLRIIDSANHFQDIKSGKCFTASPGSVYSTEVVFAPTGTLVTTDTGNICKGITSYTRLNASGHLPCSHAGELERSTLTPVGGSYRQLLYPVVHSEMPIFASFVKSGDGFLMFYHKAYYNSSTGTNQWSGRRCAYVRSTNGVDWTFGKELFPPKNDVPGHYGNIINVYYSGPYGVRMADGRILVVSAYRGSDDMRHKVLDNGLAIKISSDEGMTWSAEKLVNVGTCWEPHAIVLDGHSDHPGRVIIYYTDSCPYIEGVWSSPVISTGVSYIYSDDNGVTWKPDDPLNEHLYAYRKYRGEKSGQRAYSDQMPAVIQLCGRKQLVGCGESNYNTLGSSTTDYWIDVAYSDADGGWGVQDSFGQMPADRLDKLCAGTGSTLAQFPSGESFIGYNHSLSGESIFYFRRGDENARNWGAEQAVFSGASPAGRGKWGRFLCDNHLMIAAVGGAGGSEGLGYPLQVGLFYLNHNIHASTHNVAVDGDNEEWPDSDEALFVGSKGNMHGTARFCVRDGLLYILAEVENSSLSENDYFRLYFSSPLSSNVSSGDNFIQVKPSGKLSQKVLDASSAWETASLGAFAKVSRGTDFYYAEISVPLASLPFADGSVLVNISTGDGVDGNQSILPSGTNVPTRNWPKINY